ncbi:DUF2958 domain-containing protein [Sphingomonas koreensis]|uniref:DUF2958 domain-containing protein n=1 Tax=Sphingomonas koreensis TaxID=93064 RepID=UPI00082F8D7C|nr:DUF2958 domain-containing protein [Sphingomonas koreensis]PJI87180.1 Protein of unknown function (DUF2958) [Sphingomonas koreensis]RSU59604.1 DUF2958 domain-containing protein [Sphingomonas koreensis]RSU68758.1 DUF2958 domain-containing protein [Sphingomonas koreensis]
MILLPPELHVALRANDIARHAALRDGRREPDPLPLVKFFNPLGAATWLATELDADGDTLFGLADLGFGCPELGAFSLREIASVRLPFGLAIERDAHFVPMRPLSVWADTARRMGSIIGAEAELRRMTARHTGDELPLPPEDEGGG